MTVFLKLDRIGRLGRQVLARQERRLTWDSRRT